MRGIGAAGTPQAPSQAWLAAVANLLNLEGADAYAGLDQLSAESYASVINADAHSVMTGLDSIANRLAAAHDGGGCPSVAPAFAPTVQAGNALCPWVRVVGDWTRLDGYDTWLSQRLDYGGIFIGLDGKLAGPWTLGGMLGYVHGSEATDGLPVHATSESYQAAAYGEYARGPVWLRGTVGLAFHTAQMSRQITFTDTPLTAVGDPDGTQYFADLRAGWDIPTARFGTFTPFVAVQAQRITAPGFTESGAGALSLAIGNASTTVSRSILGAQWSASLGGVASRWTAQANLGWAHAYGALTRVIQAQFVGAPASAFTEYGAGPARDTAEIGVGVSAAVGRNAHLTLRYDGNYGGHQSASALSLAADYRW
jgi:outer membrane autotransporter protein